MICLICSVGAWKEWVFCLLLGGVFYRCGLILSVMVLRWGVDISNYVASTEPESLLGFPWHHSSREGEGYFFKLGWRWSIGFLCSLHRHCRRVGLSTAWRGWSSWFSLSLSVTTLAGELRCFLQPGRGWSLDSPLHLCWYGWGYSFFYLVLGWSRRIIIWKFSVFLALWLEGRLFLGLFCPFPLAFLGSWLSSPQSEVYEATDNPLYCSLGPKVLSHLPFFLYFQSLYMCFMYNIKGF